ncbi:hypothetical protein Xszus_02821 [Xenorhabdus szentirmaii]|nr:hypothetical protein Xsze_00736 [Xenorhabdus szentirmaii DSM 16338]PHM43042.1 hypothetical protein Xszus_02821 [Xenorhabdus szentirmaii]
MQACLIVFSARPGVEKSKDSPILIANNLHAALIPAILQ